jgi:hypothetical protein
VVGGGTIAGTGFTGVVTDRGASTGTGLNEATLGILTAAAASALITWAVFYAPNRLPTALHYALEPG